MGEYVTKQTDEAQESFDDMIATLDDIAARVRRENKKDIDISTKTEEDADNGEANAEDNTEAGSN
jgi:cell pole-organizing protein PopZ